MTGTTNTPIDRPRLVRARTGRLIEAPPEPERKPEKPPVSLRAKLIFGVGGVGFLVLVAYLFLTTQGKVGNGGKLESILRDFGHVIHEVRGPGLVR